MEERMEIELQMKIIKDLIAQRTGKNSVKIEYTKSKEIHAIDELVKKELLSIKSSEYYLSENIDDFLEKNKIKVLKLPLELDLETKDILKQLTKSSRKLAELKGITKTIPNSLILINALVLQEAKDSSQIESIITTNDELYKAEINIGVTSLATKEVQNYANALKKGFSLITEGKTLSLSFIIEIQKELEKEPTKQGIRKKFGTTIMNQSTKEILHIPPQDYEEIVVLLENLEEYINSEDEIDPLIKLAIIHHRFENIHPFPDGNGRTGRIINVLYLTLKEMLDLPILYLSSYLIKNKTEYYDLLKKVSNEDSWEEWILFILRGVEETSIETIERIKKINILMEDTKKEMKEKKPKIYSKDLLELIFIHPYTKINFIVEGLKKDRKTVSKILNELVEINILEEVKVGREKYFINTELYNLLKN